MADLSAYIDFNIILDKSLDPPVIRFIDPNHYPPGVAPTLTGIVSITQPDGGTVSGSFTSPDVYWNGSALVSPSKELRLNTVNQFQNGMYVITYTIRATGYTETVLTKTFSLNYKQPVGAVLKNFDVFTPVLTALDGTAYIINGLDYVSVQRSWSALIRTVGGTDRTITASSQDFDLAYGGNYYDAFYDVSLLANPQWTLSGSGSWVTLIDAIETIGNFQTEIPPTIPELRSGLAQLKFKIDSQVCGKCGCDAANKDAYHDASDIYDQFIDRGKSGDVEGLTLYILQLQKLFNNCIPPEYTPTGVIIPPYDFGGGVDTVAWGSITGKPSTIRIQFIIGTTPGAPSAGTSIFTNAAFVGKTGDQLIVVRGGFDQTLGNLLDGDTYFTKVLPTDNFITVFGPFQTDEKFLIHILPL